MSKKRKFAIRPVQPLEFEFADGTKKEAIFTVEALMLISEEFGDLTELAKEEKNKPYDLAAKILYCGMKILDDTVTYDEAKSILIGGGVGLLEAIFESVIETYEGMDLDIEDIKKKAEQIATTMMKR